MTATLVSQAKSGEHLKKGENAMSTQSQVLKFGAVVLQNLPEMSEDVMQGWIENPRDLQRVLKSVLCPPQPEAMVKHFIDCNTDPFVPKGWSVEEHKKGGMFEWSPTKVRLHLSPNQKDGKFIQGHKLRKELANEPVLNANVLDYLLAHPEIIPEEWKEETVFFWGTIYRDSDGYLYVRCLSRDGARWYWHCHWLVSDWFATYPAVCSQVSS